MDCKGAWLSVAADNNTAARARQVTGQASTSHSSSSRKVEPDKNESSILTLAKVECEVNIVFYKREAHFLCG